MHQLESTSSPSSSSLTSRPAFAYSQRHHHHPFTTGVATTSKTITSPATGHIVETADNRVYVHPRRATVSQLQSITGINSPASSSSPSIISAHPLPLPRLTGLPLPHSLHHHHHQSHQSHAGGSAASSTASGGNGNGNGNGAGGGAPPILPALSKMPSALSLSSTTSGNSASTSIAVGSATAAGNVNTSAAGSSVPGHAGISASAMTTSDRLPATASTSSGRQRHHIPPIPSYQLHGNASGVASPVQNPAQGQSQLQAAFGGSGFVLPPAPVNVLSQSLPYSHSHPQSHQQHQHQFSGSGALPTPATASVLPSSLSLSTSSYPTSTFGRLGASTSSASTLTASTSRDGGRPNKAAFMSLFEQMYETIPDVQSLKTQLENLLETAEVNIGKELEVEKYRRGEWERKVDERFEDFKRTLTSEMIVLERRIIGLERSGEASLRSVATASASASHPYRYHQHQRGQSSESDSSSGASRGGGGVVHGSGSATIIRSGGKVASGTRKRSHEEMGSEFYSPPDKEKRRLTTPPELANLVKRVEVLEAQAGSASAASSAESEASPRREAILHMGMHIDSLAHPMDIIDIRHDTESKALDMRMQPEEVNQLTHNYAHPDLGHAISSDHIGTAETRNGDANGEREERHESSAWRSTLRPTSSLRGT